MRFGLEWRRAAALALSLGYVLVGLASLSRVPLVWMDEPWYTQPAWSFATNGTFAEPMFPGLHGLDESNVAYGRIYLVAVAAVFRVLEVGPFQARLVSFFAGLVVIGLTYVIGRRLWSARTGAISAVVLAVSPVFVFQTHDARPEMLQLAFMLAGFWAVLRSEDSNQSRWLFAAGVIAALAADTHLNGAITPAVLGGFLLVRRSRADSLRQSLPPFAAGVAVGLLWWAAVHVLPNPTVFADQWANVWGGNLPIMELARSPLQPLFGEVDRYLTAALIWWDSAWVLPLLALVALWILRRYHRDLAIDALAAAALIHVLVMAMIVSNKTAHYAVLLWPTLALIVGRWMTVALPERVAWPTLATVLVVSIQALFWTTLSVWSADFEGYVAKLRSVIPAEAVVQGQPTYWFGFLDREYVAAHYFKSVRPYGTAVVHAGITYIIADEFFLHQQLEVERSIDREEVETFLATRATLVATIGDPFYGSSDLWQRGDYVTRIYRVNR